MAGETFRLGMKPATLSAYKPSVREKVNYWLSENLFGDNREGVNKAERLTNILETVTPYGVATMANDAGREIGKGNLLAGGMTLAMAMAPGIRTKGGKAISPTNTGWVFKDFKTPHRSMQRGDWRATRILDPLEVELPIGRLNATQKTVNPDFATPLSKNADLPFVIKKNGEFFVQDGHHRLTKIAMDGRQTAKVKMIDLDGTTQTDFPLIDLMNQKETNRQGLLARLLRGE